MYTSVIVPDVCRNWSGWVKPWRGTTTLWLSHHVFCVEFWTVKALRPCTYVGNFSLLWRLWTVHTTAWSTELHWLLKQQKPAYLSLTSLVDGTYKFVLVYKLRRCVVLSIPDITYGVTNTSRQRGMRPHHPESATVMPLHHISMLWNCALLSSVHTMDYTVARCLSIRCR